jgi:flagellar hook-basal body protein
MFSSIYTALSGMLGFSKGLDVIGNNVANLNTPGFKASELQFRDLFYRYGLSEGGASFEQVGAGVTTGSTRTVFNQGQLQDTGNDFDAAIDGNGFFVLRKDGETFYTRNGQFEIDEDGFLIEQSSQARVAAVVDGRLTDININGLRVNPPRATTEVKFNQFLAGSDTTHQVPNIVVTDAAGGAHAFTLNFTKANSVTLIDSQVSRTEMQSTVNVAQNLLSTERTTATPIERSLNTGLLRTTRPVTTTTPVDVPFYEVQPGDSFATIAALLYVNVSDTQSEALGNLLQTELGIPNLAGVVELSGFPPTLTLNGETFELNTQLLLNERTTTEDVPADLPFYEIQAGEADIQVLAQVLYNDVGVADALATALAGQEIAVGAELTNLPSTLSFTTTTTETVPLHYKVRAADLNGDLSYDAVANRLYSAPNGGADLMAALQAAGSPVPDLVEGLELANLPSTLTLSTPIAVPVDAFYAVKDGDTFESIAETLYGSRGFGAQLQEALGNPTLVPGTRLMGNPPESGFPMTLTLAGVNRWVVEVREGEAVVGQGQIRYDGSGNPIDGFRTFGITYSPAGVSSSAITFDFSGSNGFPTAAGSTLVLESQNGLSPGAIVESRFDEKGVLTLRYSNGQTTTHQQLAVALFTNTQSLTQSGNNLFTARRGENPTIVAAGDNGAGNIATKQLELSNVELTEQFTDIVVVQRGFQASSQVLSIANEMAQQLLDLRSRR